MMLSSFGIGDEYSQRNNKEGARYLKKGQELRRDYLIPNEEIKFESEVNLKYADKSSWRVFLTSQRFILFRDSGYSVSDDSDEADDAVVSERLGDIREIKYQGSVSRKSPSIVVVGKTKHELIGSSRVKLKRLYQDLRDYIRH
jgi:hypothetical protein